MADDRDTRYAMQLVHFHSPLTIGVGPMTVGHFSVHLLRDGREVALVGKYPGDAVATILKGG